MKKRERVRPHFLALIRETFGYQLVDQLGDMVYGQARAQLNAKLHHPLHYQIYYHVNDCIKNKKGVD